MRSFFSLSLRSFVGPPKAADVFVCGRTARNEKRVRHIECGAHRDVGCPFKRLYQSLCPGINIFRGDILSADFAIDEAAIGREYLDADGSDLQRLAAANDLAEVGR